MRTGNKSICYIFFCLFTAAGGANAQKALLPQPRGPYAIGTKTFYFTDKSRPDSLLKQDRAIIVQAWYPCKARKDGELMDYIPEKKLVDFLMKTKYYGLDSTVLSSFYTLKTHAYKNAPVEKGKFPLVFFSPGFGVLISNYTSIYEELASRGVIVLAMDHLYAGTTILPDKRIVDVNMYPDTVYTALSVDCVKDESFILDRLAEKKEPISKLLKNSYQPERIGATGHSFGGNVALLATYSDPRVKFNINLDGGDFSATEGKDLTAPSLILREQPEYSDEELIKKGRDPVKWRAGGDKGLLVYKAALKNARPGYMIKVDQTGHLSFSDAPFLMPRLLTMFLGTYLSPARNLELITDCMLKFISAYDDAGKLKAMTDSFKLSKELTVYRINPL